MTNSEEVQVERPLSYKLKRIGWTLAPYVGIPCAIIGLALGVILLVGAIVGGIIIYSSWVDAHIDMEFQPLLAVFMAVLPGLVVVFLAAIGFIIGTMIALRKKIKEFINERLTELNAEYDPTINV
jgi:ABC-type multidrug transport system fused ATPase/permease subunit